jgi:hypothetical protein
MTRELARASSSPVVRKTRNISGETLRGSPPRHQSSHRKGPNRRVDPNAKCGEHRYDATSRSAKERRMDVRQS